VPGFTYYVPTDLTQPTAELVADLAYALDYPNVAVRGVRGGPDNGNGLAIGPADADRLGYFADRQTWKPLPGSDAWLGWYTDQPPTPDDLARPDGLAGHLVTLGDGRQWVAPVARGVIDAGETLDWYYATPRQVDVDDAGEWVAGEVVPKYRELWQLAVAWWDAKKAGTLEGTNLTFDFANYNDGALTALATNYRVGRFEVAKLGLFDEHNPAAILDALVDWPTVTEWLKKNLMKSTTAAAGLHSGNGQTAELAATAQH